MGRNVGGVKMRKWGRLHSTPRSPRPVGRFRRDRVRWNALLVLFPTIIMIIENKVRLAAGWVLAAGTQQRQNDDFCTKSLIFKQNHQFLVRNRSTDRSSQPLGRFRRDRVRWNALHLLFAIITITFGDEVGLAAGNGSLFNPGSRRVPVRWPLRERTGSESFVFSKRTSYFCASKLHLSSRTRRGTVQPRRLVAKIAPMGKLM